MAFSVLVPMVKALLLWSLPVCGARLASVSPTVANHHAAERCRYGTIGDQPVLLGQQIPEVANLSLADAVDAAETLFQTIRIPWQVVVHHEVGALEIDTFAGCVGGKQNLDFRIVPERLLRLHPLLAPHPAMDEDHALLAAQKGGEATFQVVQGIAVFGEQNQFLG